MKASRISLIAALIAGVMLAYSPALRAEDAKEGKDTKKHEGGPGRNGAAMKEHFDKMAEDLKLTDEQKTKVRELFKAQAEKGRALREDSSLTDEQKREKFKASREEMKTKMKGILTVEQFEKWEKNRPQGRPGGMGGQGHGPHKAGGDKK
jgi:periplasmic protein CpxP/Spy